MGRGEFLVLETTSLCVDERDLLVYALPMPVRYRLGAGAVGVCRGGYDTLDGMTRCAKEKVMGKFQGSVDRVSCLVNRVVRKEESGRLPTASHSTFLLSRTGCLKLSSLTSQMKAS
jgi:hypothetical protein